MIEAAERSIITGQPVEPAGLIIAANGALVSAGHRVAALAVH